MKYPKHLGPQTQSEARAILYQELAYAYNLLAQYEADEYQREEDERRRRMEEAVMDRDAYLSKEYKEARDRARKQEQAMRDCPVHGERSEPAKSAAAHREDEQQ